MQFRQSTHLLTENIIYSYSDWRKARIKLAENVFHNVKSHSSWYKVTHTYTHTPHFWVLESGKEGKKEARTWETSTGTRLYAEQ